MPRNGGFDFRRRRNFPGWGARVEWPPINPVPIDPSIYTYISETTIIENENEEEPAVTPTDTNAKTIYTWSTVTGPGREALETSIGNRAWTANYAIHIPFILETAVTCNQMVWWNGGSVGGNTDIGIYDYAGTTLYVKSGPTANSGTNVTQTANVTDTAIPAGVKLWMSLACDSGSQWYFGPSATARVLEHYGVMQKSSGYPLGSSITLASPAINELPLFGFTARSVV